MIEFNNDKEAAIALQEKYKQLKSEISKAIVGQTEVVDAVLISILCNGHSLLIGLPGLAKTLLIKSVSEVLDLKFSRIQFTPDLMPSDITGSEILDEKREFKFIRGPLFANIILADEINRTPPKTQAALLEAMQEKSVTVGGKFHKLEEPFFVLATQNPIDQEGTYPLPEAQLDRFMFNIYLNYPSLEDEIEIIRKTTQHSVTNLQTVMHQNEIIYFQNLVRRVPVTDNVLNYAVSLVSKTRPNTTHAHAMSNEFLSYGAGPRAGQFLILGAKCHALLHGKFSPDIEDVKAIAENVLKHRLIRNFKAEAENVSLENIIKELL
jgi:MoxR-like ATPase